MKQFVLWSICLILCAAVILMMTIPAYTVTAEIIVKPDTPALVPYPGAYADREAYDAWRSAVRERQSVPTHNDELAAFLQVSVSTFLAGSGSENRVYSPVSLYMALAMLAETTGGSTREEILTMLGAENIETLRQQATDVWKANYCDDGMLIRTLATSLWLNEDIAFNPETMSALAEHYHAAAYRGEMGSEKLNHALQTWLNDNTLGLLKEQAATIQLPADTVMAIASTVAFKARWSSEFYEGDNMVDVFHAPDGDVECTYMRKSTRTMLYYADSWQAISLPYDQEGRMMLILPDEGVSVDALLTGSACLNWITGQATPDARELQVNLSLPRFDVTSQLELSDGLQSMGLTEVFDASRADFSPLTDELMPISLSQVRHDARVVIDEEGTEAAAYTVMMLAGAAIPTQVEEIDFVLDRPFLFVITGAGELPLFIGVVNHP
ncbi:MAG: hypothetical protein IKK57_12930 [Clostridia bacterium]|nr:hypothetical protein [Clostridia bacterium]